jgi:2-polyprenyl-3-methyl-5-hydroxy-6-metoxy-1,4-benzoquinol methylase
VPSANKNSSLRGCPVCDTPALLVRRLDRDFIKQALGVYYGKVVPERVVPESYDLLRCPRCSLEYASPMTPGDDAFYSWISKFDDYYPPHRWEWSVVAGEISKWSPDPPTLLEVGCGSGSFLKSLRNSVRAVSAVGLDPTESAVHECLRAGLVAHAETLERYIERVESTGKTFDFICAFHCLEHVADPRGLVETMATLAHKNTRIFLSTPYSPMSFETGWFDPLNHPPHHMTRWNAAAYQTLAELVGLKVDLIFPPAESLVKKTITALRLACGGPKCSSAELLKRTTLRPHTVLRELARQASRERHNGHVVPDVVLACFTVPA